MFKKLLVLLALAGAVSVHAQAERAEFEVLGARCDAGLGAVHSVRLLVTSPGLVELSWDNSIVCGKRS